MNTTTTTATRTLASLNDGDTFTFNADGSGAATVCRHGLEKRYRTAYGQTYPMGDTDQLVYNVKTEAERDAEYAAQRQAEMAKERADAAAFLAIVGAVGKVLGMKVRQPAGDDLDRRMQCYLDGKDGVILWCSGSSWHRKAGKIAISGILPRDGGVMGHGEINVSDQKTPKQIAGDITRRLLPTYLEALAKARDSQRVADAFKAQTDATVAALVKATKGTAGQSGRVHAKGLPSMTVSGTSIRFECYSVPLACMLEIAAVLKRHEVE